MAMLARLLCPWFVLCLGACLVDWSDRDPHESVQEPATDDAGAADMTADAGPSDPTDPDVPALTAQGRFATLGERRGDGTVTIVDDGFELGPRLCTPDQQFCIRGGFEP